MREDQVCLLALCRVKGLSWYLIAREVLKPKGLEHLLAGRISEASKEANEGRPTLRSALQDIEEYKSQAREIIDAATSEGARLTTVLDSDYPLNLRAIFNLPPFLFYRGQLSSRDDARSVAVVGTREPSSLGVRRARKMATLLAERGVTVLSGLARGIDTAAHEAALKAGGRTVAVFGTGIDMIYPEENKDLAERIAATGCVVSQFWPETGPRTYTFPRRNITTSGMGQGTVVIEASATSGAKMQARLALEHGKKVFLIKTLVTSQLWARNYLKRGAIEVGDVADILAHLDSPDAIIQRAHRVEQLGLELG